MGGVPPVYPISILEGVLKKTYEGNTCRDIWKRNMGKGHMGRLLLVLGRHNDSYHLDLTVDYIF